MLVEARGLGRSFGRLAALEDVSFSFGSGAIYGFVGPNGAGKTTAMRILATLDLPDEGDAVIDGVSICQYPEQARRLVGFVPDTLPAIPHTTVRDYLDFFARAHGLRSPERQRLVEGVEEFTGLSGLRERLITALSKGMKQRVSVARALLHDPPVLILDEPAAGLDPRARIELRELLKALAARGKAILVSSHILGELGEMCDGAVIIEEGSIVRAGTIAELSTGDATRRVLCVRPLDRHDDVLRALLEHPDCVGVTASGKGFEAEMAIDDAGAAELLASLVKKGFSILEYRQKDVDLEAVFMKLTSGEVS